MNPYRVVKDFEGALCDYTGAPYAVTVNSCTSALFLALMWHQQLRPKFHDLSFDGTPIYFDPPIIVIPRRTYVSVPMQIIHAGMAVAYRDEDWHGGYQLFPLPIWDYARRFTSGMYRLGQFQCVSFHWSKILGIQQGGAILHDSPEADAWLRRARFDGRTEGVHPKDDEFGHIGWHMYMSPEIAAEGLMRLSILPERNPDLPNDDYPDLSTKRLFG